MIESENKNQQLNPFIFESPDLAVRLWFFTSLVFGAGWFLVGLTGNEISPWFCIIVTIVALVTSLPILLALLIIIPLIQKTKNPVQIKILLLTLACIMCCAVYCATALWFGWGGSHPKISTWPISTGVLSASALTAVLLLKRRFTEFFARTKSQTQN